jgi:hypothetical protein
MIIIDLSRVLLRRFAPNEYCNKLRIRRYLRRVSVFGISVFASGTQAVMISLGTDAG